jgi:hypothetical protein
LVLAELVAQVKQLMPLMEIREFLGEIVLLVV